MSFASKGFVISEIQKRLAGVGGGTSGAAYLPQTTSVGSPAHSFVGDTDTGVHRIGADTPAMVAGGKARVVAGGPVTLPDNTATTIATVSMPTGSTCSGKLTVHVHATDGTEYQSASLEYLFAAQNKSGTPAGAISLIPSAVVAQYSSGNISSFTPSLSMSANSMEIQYLVDSTLSTTSITVSFELEYYSSQPHTLTIP